MAEKSRGIKDLTTFQGIPVDDPVLAAQLERLRPKDRYFETYPVQGIKSITKDNPRYSPGLEGYVRPRLPEYQTEYFNRGTTQIPENKVIYIQPNRDPRAAPDPRAQYGTFEHEKQHILNVLREKENTWPLNEALEFSNMKADDIKMRHWDNTPPWAKKNESIKENPINTQFAINDFYDKYHQDLAQDFKGSGFFSEVRRIEQSLPPGVILSDTPLGKELFADRPELYTAYLNATRPQYATTIREDTGSPRYQYFEPESPKKQQGILSLIRDYFKKATTY